ncbi:hypothetical protein GH714_039320 [Hevea brasiliensis]|uniref:Uncharacterized protein n=1 Tax=Hevea brasiliensis TaxID=3981 RepID=A0A6A6KEA9_HEVBR|nr:hypothetical protein GH714_039320 [Hevea brasiliensis]
MSRLLSSSHGDVGTAAQYSPSYLTARATAGDEIGKTTLGSSKAASIEAKVENRLHIQVPALSFLLAYILFDFSFYSILIMSRFDQILGASNLRKNGRESISVGAPLRACLRVSPDQQKVQNALFPFAGHVKSTKVAKWPPPEVNGTMAM